MVPKKSYSASCECCHKWTEDVYDKGWMRFDGHLALARGRSTMGKGLSHAINGDWYFCSWECLCNFISANLLWRRDDKK
jgi:hypothetical protein